MTNNSRFLFAWAMAGVACLTCCAEEIVVGVGETHAIATETATTQEEVVRIADRAMLEKTGAGTLTLKTGTFAANAPITVNVREGAVKLVDSDPLVTTYPQPTDVMDRAAFWVDAGVNVQLKEGSENEVEAWLDVRETGDGSEANPFVYTRSVAFTNDWLTAFPLRQDYLEQTGVYFRGFGSGCFMNWVKPSGSQENIQNIRHAFVVHGGANAKGHFLGQRKSASAPFFQRPSDTLMWTTHNGENAPLHASRTYLNGTEVDAFRTWYAANSRHVTEVEALSGTLAAMCFYNDRDMQLKTTAGTNMANNADGKAMNAILGTSSQIGGGDRAGGDHIHEVLLFTNALTAAERQSVSDWLNQKWRGTLPPSTLPALSVGLSTNATIELAGNLPSAVTVRGDGCIRKTEDTTATLRSSYEPRNSARRVAVMGGKLNLGYSIPLVCEAGDVLTSERRYYGPELVPPTKDSVSSRLVKNGSGPITLDAIPEGVTNLVVNGGELCLADPERPQLVVPVVSSSATIPDADFEGYPASSHTAAYSYINDGAEVRGWHAIVPGLMGSSTCDSKVFFFDQAKGSPSGWNMVMQEDASGVLAVKNNASAWCEVTIPEEGDYVLTFRAAPRNGYMGDQLDVMIGEDADSLVSFGAFKTSRYEWRTFSFDKIHLTAGTKQFWLKSKVLNDDRCTQFDDFQLTRVADSNVWDLPNGGFEHHDNGFNTTTFTVANVAYVPGFTVKQCDNQGTADEGAAQSNSTFTARGAFNDTYFNRPWNRPESETQFYMSGNGSQLKTTFTPPAGRWRFRADYCLWCVTWRSGDRYVVSADLGIGGETIALGAVTNLSHALQPVDWPNEFTVDGSTPVTLTLTGAVAAGKTNGHGILDNLALVRALSPGENLLRDGGFETLNPWTVVVTPKPTGVGGSQRQAYGSFYETHFGMERFEGGSCMKLVNDDVISQSVTFPAGGGIYRFSANMASRSTPGSGSFGNGLNPAAFFLARNGVTNWLGCTDKVMMTNYHEYAYQVRIPEAGGTYDVGFRGMTVWDGTAAGKVDRTTLIDAAQVYRIETEKPIVLPESLEIDVAAGAQLTLDFDGTNEVRRLKIAGRNYIGTVSLAEHPELLGTLNGRGTLYIRPRGTVLLFR